jgi:hypothetical protein
VIFSFKKLRIGRHEIKKNTFSTLVLELFCQSIATCKKLIIQKSTPPYTAQSAPTFSAFPATSYFSTWCQLVAKSFLWTLGPHSPSCLISPAISSAVPCCGRQMAIGFHAGAKRRQRWSCSASGSGGAVQAAVELFRQQFSQWSCSASGSGGAVQPAAAVELFSQWQR